MKKLFTLVLVLLVATAGYSQVRKVSKNDDAKKKVATMQVFNGREMLENVQSEPNMVRWNYGEGELDYTFYDWQSNCGARTWNIVWPDNKVNFAFTCALQESYGDRGTAIGTYDYDNDEWIPSGGKIETEKTGFGTIARFKDNGIVVAAHTATQCGVYIIEDKDNITPNSVPVTSYFDPTYDPCWPNVMTSGANRDIIHVVNTAYAADGQSISVPGAEGVNNPIIYFRSMDGGLTWDKQNVILPYMGTDGGLDWGSNVCYWMETTEDNCLALVVNNAWSDGMVLYSYDDGETWERKVFYHHPGINTTFSDIIFMYPRWVSAQWGYEGELCIAYEWNGSTGEPGSGSYYPGLGGVAFWSENMPYTGPEGNSYYQGVGYDPTNPLPPTPGQPFILDSAYIDGDLYAAWPRWSDQSWDNPAYFGYVAPLDENENWQSWAEATEFNIEDFTLHGAYNCGIASMPVLAMVPGTDGWDMVAVWSAMDEHNIDGSSGNYYFKLFAAYSGDRGMTWSRPVHLTTDFMWSLNEFVYTQAVVMGTTLVIAVQTDGEAGTFVQGNDPDGANNLYQGFTFDLNELFPGVGVGVPEVIHNTHMTVYPNPAVNQISVTLNQSADIVIYNIMGQAVMNVEGHAGANSINISELGAGIYFVNAGNDTQKFIVK